MSRSYSASMRKKFWRLVTAIACLETQITTPARAYDWAHNSSIDLLGTRCRLT
jgi:hypothetical protein